MGNTNLSDGNKCPICRKLGADINSNARNDFFLHYRCTNCGCFFVPDTYRIYPEIRLEDIYNLQHLQSYLFYHKSNLRPVICKKEYFNKHITDEFVEIYNITPEMVESWYPKNFAEKNDCILLYLNKNSQYIGHEKVYTYRELVDIFMLENSIETFKGLLVLPHIRSQIDFYLSYFYKEDLLEDLRDDADKYIPHWGDKIKIQIAPKGLARVDELLKNQIKNKNVFVAMKFGEGTKELREKIREGLKGYNVRIMDEIEHNHQIVPEMLYEIRNSKFVIAELSHHNNGAYYEAGYALGLGKEVIHICDKKELKSGLHFDVAQVNTLFYDSIDEIPEKLRKRIEATIK